MFSDNDKISQRQLGRQLALGLSGVFLLVLPESSQLLGLSGLLGCLLGLAALWILLLFVLRHISVGGLQVDQLHPLLRWPTVLFYESYLVLSGAYLVRTAAGMVRASLISEYSMWEVSGILVLVALIGTGRNIQRRARIGETAAVPVLGGLFLLVLLAAVQAGGLLWETDRQLSGRQILRAAYDFFCGFSIIGVLPFILRRVKGGNDSVKALYAGSGTAALLAISGLWVLQALFGCAGVQHKKYPVTALMATVSFPGKFLDRFDVVWLSLLVFALLFAVGTVLFYSTYLLERRHSCWVAPAGAVLILVAALAEVGQKTVADLYPAAVRWCYMPLFVIFCLCGCCIKKKGVRRGSALAVVLCLLAGLWGCGGVEPEKRNYPLVVSIDFRDGVYQVIYGMADLTAVTGQDKSGEGSGKERSTLLFEGESMEGITDAYDRTQENYLDMGHVQVLVLGKRLEQEPEAFKEVLQALEQHPVLGDSTVVFSCREPRELLELNGNRIESLGDYLTGIYENRMGKKAVEMMMLQDVYRGWHQEGSIRLPELTVAADFPEVLPLYKAKESRPYS